VAVRWGREGEDVSLEDVLRTRPRGGPSVAMLEMASKGFQHSGDVELVTEGGPVTERAVYGCEGNQQRTSS
jgi:hypothetical protein